MRLVLIGQVSILFYRFILTAIYLTNPGKCNVLISLKTSLKFVPKVQINNVPALFQIMAWRRPGAKPLSESMILSYIYFLCVCTNANTNFYTHVKMQTFLIIWRILLPPKDRQIDNLNLVYTLNLVIWVQYGYNKLKKILLTFSHPWHSVEHFV